MVKKKLFNLIAIISIAVSSFIITPTANAATPAQAAVDCDLNNDGKCDYTDILMFVQRVIAFNQSVPGTPAPPTATPAVPTATATAVQPTATLIPATATGVPPTVAPATVTPVPPTATALAQPTATMAMAMTGLCGESLNVWHAPVIGTCQTKHEHGDAPPAWVMNSVKKPEFMGQHSTSGIENTIKHNFMKGYLFQDSTKSCLKIYVIQHGAALGMERIAQYHSTQWWVLDCGGGVSYGANWSDFGTPKAYPGGDRILAGQNFDAIHQERANEGIIRVATAQNGCEQWYSAAGGTKPDMSLLICGSPEIYNSAEDTNPSGEYEAANQQFNGNIGNFRQLDFALPLDRILVGNYKTDQFGRVVNNCTGNTVYDGVTFGVVCQNTSVTQRLFNDVNTDTAEFGTKRLFGIARNENYPSQGVVAPN